MRLKKQDEILDIAVRKKIIEEIEMPENKRRKDQAYMRYQMYKDRTDRFVLELLLKQFDQSTVEEMFYALSNVSLVRKVIDKLAKVYNHGVDRNILINGESSEEETEKLETLQELLQFDSRMKQANRLVKLHRNLAFYIKPCPYYDDDGNELNRVRLTPMSPYLYDVIEEYYDRTKPMCYVLSNYEQSRLYASVIDPGTHQNLKNNPMLFQNRASSTLSAGNKMDESIADKKEDEDADKKHKEYVWWSNNYHFTTDQTGAIINESGLEDSQTENPIGMMPFVNFAIDQEGSFWAEGGDDLITAGLNANSMITNINHIGVTQGYGQFWMSGKDLPATVKTGPSKIIKMEQEEGEPTPQVGFASANPPLDQLRNQVEFTIALALTTNNLSTSGVSGQLGANQSFASGISLMIDKAESLEDMKEQRQIFIDNEQEIWEIITKWLEVFQENGSLDPDYEDLSLSEGFEVSLEFVEPGAIASESEKLDNIQKRKDLGLNTMRELIKKDQPGLSDEQIEEKLKQIEEEKKKRLETFGPIGENGQNANPFANRDDQDDKEEKDEDEPEDGDSEENKRDQGQDQ